MKSKNEVPQTLFQLLILMAKSMFKGIHKMILHSLLIGAIAWFYHAYLVVVINNGYLKEGSPAAAILALNWRGFNNIPVASIFWGIAGWLATYLFFTRIIANGPKKFARDILMTPGWIVEGFKGIKGEKISGFLIVMGFGMIISIILKSPWITLILAVAVTLIMTSRDEGLMYITVKLAYSDFQRVFQKNKPRRPLNQGHMAILFMGVITALITFSILPSKPHSTYLVIALIIAILIFRKVKNKGVATNALFFIFAAANIIWFISTETQAHDGGFSEYGRDWGNWWRGEGRNEALATGNIPALSATIGAALGIAASNISNVLSGIFSGLGTPSDVATEGVIEEATVPGRQNGFDLSGFMKEAMDIFDKVWGAGGEDAFKGIAGIITDIFTGGSLEHALNAVMVSQRGLIDATRAKAGAFTTMKNFLSKGTYIDEFGNLKWKNAADKERYMQLVRNYNEKSQALKAANATNAEKLKLLQSGKKASSFLSSVGSGISTGLTLGGIFLDTLGNMTEHNRADGSLISGDSIPVALGKSATINTIISKLVEKNPAVAVMELATYLTVGDVRAGGIISPISNIKNGFNYAVDLIRDPGLAKDRMKAGAYGENVKNFHDTYELAKEFTDNPRKFMQEVGAVGNDPEFFRNMHETNYELFRKADGTQGYFAAGAETITDMGIAMTQTAAELAGKAGEMAGTAFESTSQAVSSTVRRIRNWFR